MDAGGSESAGITSLAVEVESCSGAGVGDSLMGKERTGVEESGVVTFGVPSKFFRLDSFFLFFDSRLVVVELFPGSFHSQGQLVIGSKMYR